MDRVLERKLRDAEHWRTQIIFYDERGRRVFTDYLSLPVSEEQARNIVEDLKRYIPSHKVLRVKYAIVIERRLVGGFKLEDE